MATPISASSDAPQSDWNITKTETSNAPTIVPNKQSRNDGQAKQAKAPSGNVKGASGGAKDGTVQDGDAKISNAELKKRAKAEKAARRAATKPAPEQNGPSGQQPSSNRRSSAGKEQLQSPKTLDMGKHHKGSATTTQARILPMRQGGAQGVKETAVDTKKKLDDKRVSIFGHLYGQPKKASIARAGKEVHPAVLALGLQMRDYVICGSNARCVAMLLCFKRVIESYTTPAGISLSRHLTTYLSHQITYLNQCRPLSISQGNSIRWLKLKISTIDPSTPESEAKLELCDAIDSFIREKITVADQVIARDASNKIQNGDVILTYAKSSIVEKTLLEAHRAGKQFRVIAVDSRLLFEGRNLARSLASAGIEVQYTLTHAISHAIQMATKVFLGAHAMMSNGRLYSRVGTALVAMMAKEEGTKLPVIVCCETVKFTGRVALDSIVMNEIAGPDDLVENLDEDGILTSPATMPSEAAKEGPKGKKGSSAKGGEKSKSDKEGEDDDEEGKSDSGKGLKGWRDQPNLQLLNIMYDVTPADYLDMVITELGSLPPSAVPVVHRMSDEKGA